MPTLFECLSCKTVKPSTEFSPNRATKSGFQTRCKPCLNAHARAKKLAERGGIPGKRGRPFKQVKPIEPAKTVVKIPTAAELKAAKNKAMIGRGEAALARWRDYEFSRIDKARQSC